MRFVNSSSIFLAEGSYLVIQTNVFKGSLDDQDVVYLSCIGLSQGVRCSF